MEQTLQTFTKYERARIIGARALQIAMDAPLLLKVSDDKLKEIKFDALQIAEMEFAENVLPITVHRPTPKKRKDKLAAIKEEAVSDEELVAKEHEVEKEITKDAVELNLVEGDEAEDYQDEPVSSAPTSSEEAA